MSRLQSRVTEFQAYLVQLHALQSAMATLSWDRETYLPVKANPDRGQVLSVLSGMYHRLLTDKQLVKLVEQLMDQRDELAPMPRRSVQLMHRGLQEALKLPIEFVEESQKITNDAHACWVSAKTNNDYASYAPHLAKVVEMKKRSAGYIHPDWSVYDACIDQYEEGLKSTKLLPLLKELRSGLQVLLPKIQKHQPKDVINPLEKVEFPRAELTPVLHSLIRQIGFDLDAGNLSHVAHPFEISISRHDVRLNTHFDPLHHSFTVMSTIHELGHGLYEQFADPALEPWGLDQGVTLGIHESQSRLLENMIGRSKAFWSYLWPQLVAACPQLDAYSIDQMVAALNHVEPTLIRTESDEVTYNAHIIVRVEAEQKLLTDQLTVKDLPEFWQETMKELVGISPTTDREGVLQDVHWSWGDFGYFPTYTLGNLNSAQLWKSFTTTFPNWEASIAEGDFTSYFAWFKEKIWQHGSLFTAEEIMHQATGQTTQVQPFLEYLEEKYLA
jgi:carboxypeptidase Taq